MLAEDTFPTPMPDPTSLAVRCTNCGNQVGVWDGRQFSSRHKGREVVMIGMPETVTCEGCRSVSRFRVTVRVVSSTVSAPTPVPVPGGR